MGRILLRLSDKKNHEGKSEVIVKFTINAHKRPCFKTGVFINQEIFKARGEGKKREHYIEIPKQKKSNYKEQDEAREAQLAINMYCSRLERLFQIGKKYNEENLTREWIAEYYSITQNMNIEDITMKSILDEKERIEKEKEEQKKKEEQKSIYEWAEIYLTQKRFSTDHTKAFKVLMRDWMRYEEYNKRTNNINYRLDIYNLSKKDIIDFENYLRKEHELASCNQSLFKELLKLCPKEITPKHKTPKIVKRSDNSIIKLMKKYKAYTHWLYENDIINNKPFDGYKIEAEKYGEPIYLTINERDIIANHDFSNNKNLELQRDIFTFQCLVGCRVGDLMQLTSSHIQDKTLTYTPHKTKDKTSSRSAIIPLTDKAFELIAKYEGKDEKGRLFPFISPQKYCEAIKKIFIECNINRNVQWRNPKTGETETLPIYKVASSHMARKTFIGNIYKNIQDPNIIGKMSGHVEGSKAFSRYRNIDKDILKTAVQKIEVSNNKEPNKTDIADMYALLCNEGKTEVLKIMEKFKVQKD